MYYPYSEKKALISFAISFAITAICGFVFANAKSRVSHNAAHLFHYLSASHVHIDKERPSTSREDNSRQRQQQCDSSESVQIIKSVQNSEVGSSSEEIVEISSGNQTKSSSSDSVQIIEKSRTSDDESSTGRTKLKRKQTEGISSESVQIVKCVKTTKESHLKTAEEIRCIFDEICR